MSVLKTEKSSECEDLFNFLIRRFVKIFLTYILNIIIKPLKLFLLFEQGLYI